MGENGKAHSRVQGHGTCCWVCKEMAHVGVKGNYTSWEETEWHIVGCKNMEHVVGVQAYGTCCRARVWRTLKEAVRMYLRSLWGQYQRDSGEFT